MSSFRIITQSYITVAFMSRKNSDVRQTPRDKEGPLAEDKNFASGQTELEEPADTMPHFAFVKIPSFIGRGKGSHCLCAVSSEIASIANSNDDSVDGALDVSDVSETLDQISTCACCSGTGFRGFSVCTWCSAYHEIYNAGL